MGLIIHQKFELLNCQLSQNKCRRLGRIHIGSMVQVIQASPVTSNIVCFTMDMLKATMPIVPDHFFTSRNEMVIRTSVRTSQANKLDGQRLITFNSNTSVTMSPN